MNKKEYYLKVLVAGGGELLKPQLFVLSTILFYALSVYTLSQSKILSFFLTQ